MIRTKPEFAIKVNDLYWRFFELTCFVISWTLKYTRNDLFSVSYPNGYKSGLCFIVKMHCFLQIGGSWIKWVNILLIRPSNIILCMINLKRAQFYWYHCFEMITSPDWSYLSIIQKMNDFLVNDASLNAICFNLHTQLYQNSKQKVRNYMLFFFGATVHLTWPFCTESSTYK